MYAESPEQRNQDRGSCYNNRNNKSNMGSARFKFGKKYIGKDCPTYFIADIAANHDGSIDRAKHLITLAKECFADAVKFQHHNVKKYVNDKGFKQLGKKLSHQSKWDKSIYEVYKDAEVPLAWTEELIQHCQELDIEFFTTPYDLDMVSALNQYVPGFKIGSGDICWDEMLEKVASLNKPVLFSTGASTMDEVINAYSVIIRKNKNIVLMQCNTNYTNSVDNFKYINLNVLKTYRSMYPETILGLSDHTKGCETVLGAIALGAKVIEKHFTDDNSREGPDHPFSMNPEQWKQMVESSRILETALGTSIKKVEVNELETVVLQRRSVIAISDIPKGTQLRRELIEYQRPCPTGALTPNSFKNYIDKKLDKQIIKGDSIYPEDFTL